MTTILITGCARGLGLATTTHLLSLPPSHPTHPSLIFATYRHEPSAELASLVESDANRDTMKEDANGPSMKEDTIEGLRTYGKEGAGRLVLVRLNDVASETDVVRAMEEVKDVLEAKKGSGRGLDVLVNNAGAMHRSDGGIEGL